MTPGLHELECRKCGAPISPPAKSTVVRCAHCGQPHMWIAPPSGGQGQWVAQQAQVRGGGSMSWLGFVAAAVVALAAVGVVLGVLVFSGSRQKTRPQVTVTADTPLQIGDGVTVNMTANESCSSFISALLDGGRVLVADCGDNSSLPVDRSLLELDTYAYTSPKPDDVALEKTAAGWSRVVVVGLEAGERVRVEPLLGGAAQIVDRAVLHLMWSNSTSTEFRWVPLPADASLVADDIVNYRDGGVIRSGKVMHIDGSDVELSPGYMSNGTFTSDKDAVVARRARGAVLVQMASLLSPPAATHTLLAPKDGRWLRAKLVSSGEHGRWTMQAGDGAKWLVWGGQVLTLPHS